MISARFLLVVLGFVLSVILSPIHLEAQKKTKYNRTNRRMLKKRYGNTIDATKQCRWLDKKKYKSKNVKVVIRGKKPESIPLAEYDPSDKPPRPPAKPEPEAIAKQDDFHDKTFEEQTLDERHIIEDEVLAKNNLPGPTSKKHEEIRKLVEQKLKGHKGGDPIRLEPLYFTFDESEFSVVDMEPFLIAVEYALQGRIILIEGHTDSKGQDNYNVQLSIRRVEKIRQLMHDMGVPDERISVVGYGEEVAEHDNTTLEGRQKNRRVDFTAF